MKASLPGKVEYAGRKGGYGNLVIMKHCGEVSETRYAHLSKIHVRQGQDVKRGDVIALSGATGRVTGPHLHFEIYSEGKAVDPGKYLSENTHLVSQAAR